MNQPTIIWTRKNRKKQIEYDNAQDFQIQQKPKYKFVWTLKKINETWEINQKNRNPPNKKQKQYNPEESSNAIRINTNFDDEIKSNENMVTSFEGGGRSGRNRERKNWFGTTDSNGIGIRKKAFAKTVGGKNCISFVRRAKLGPKVLIICLKNNFKLF